MDAMEADIGLIGLAAMGQNLALNMSDHGYSVVAYDRSKATTEGFLGGRAAGLDIQGAFGLRSA